MTWRPSIFMSRRASRLTIEVVNVRIERVQAISDADAMAEGCASSADWQAFGAVAFQQLWDSINGERFEGRARWEKNPWVWVVEFRRA